MSGQQQAQKRIRMQRYYYFEDELIASNNGKCNFKSTKSVCAQTQGWTNMRVDHSEVHDSLAIQFILGPVQRGVGFDIASLRAIRGQHKK